MTTPHLIIVSGLPGSGKSTLATRLADHFMLPLISKDMIKETLCDTLECNTLAQSQSYGHASILLLYQFAEQLLKRQQSCIIESFFHAKFAVPDILRMQQKSLFEIIQIYCYADPTLLATRVRERWTSGERHRGHMEHLRTTKQPDSLAPEHLQPLPLKGHTIKVDTTDFAHTNYEELFVCVKNELWRNR